MSFSFYRLECYPTCLQKIGKRKFFESIAAPASSCLELFKYRSLGKIRYNISQNPINDLLNRFSRDLDYLLILDSDLNLW